MKQCGFVCLLVLLVCLTTPTSAQEVCQSSVDPGNPYYDRFEGTSYDNACSSDVDCSVSGCSGEACAAAITQTTCEALPEFPSGTCECVNAVCIWNECPDCPDGTTEGAEECDDGNLIEDDGCASDCTIVSLAVPTTSSTFVLVLGLLLVAGLAWALVRPKSARI